MPEPKTSRYWSDRGFQFFSLGNCDACGAPVEFWNKGNQLFPIDKDTMETHYASCPNAKQFRQEQRLREGVL